MLNYNYDLKLNLKELLETFDGEIESSDDFISILLTLSCLVKTDFKLMDERFEHLGKLFLSQNDFHSDQFFYMKFIRDAFSELMLNNMGFSQTVLFPDIDIRMIKSKLQVDLLLDEKNFILLPNILVKCSDIYFTFK
jgi:hypothetical protein